MSLEFIVFSPSDSPAKFLTEIWEYKKRQIFTPWSRSWLGRDQPHRPTTKTGSLIIILLKSILLENSLFRNIQTNHLFTSKVHRRAWGKGSHHQNSTYRPLPLIQLIIFFRYVWEPPSEPCIFELMMPCARKINMIPSFQQGRHCSDPSQESAQRQAFSILSFPRNRPDLTGTVSRENGSRMGFNQSYKMIFSSSLLSLFY